MSPPCWGSRGDPHRVGAQLPRHRRSAAEGELGSILTAGKDNIEIAWWLSVFPGLAIFITVLGYNLLGEGLRDALDPRLKI